jgi:hypothetical protein
LDFVSDINAMRAEWVIAVERHRCGRRWIKVRGELPVGSPAQVHVVEDTCGGANRRYGVTEAATLDAANDSHDQQRKTKNGDENRVGHLCLQASVFVQCIIAAVE